jgi:hypothetical protein
MPQAYFGTLVEGFPNFFLVNGPDAVGPSVTDVVEALVKFIINSMEQATALKATALEVDAGNYKEFNQDIQRRANASVTVLGNCNSFYRKRGDGGVYTHWPDTNEKFMDRILSDAAAAVVYRTADAVS